MQKTEAGILIIDDNLDVLESAEMFLEEYFTRVSILDTPKDIIQVLNNYNYDVVLLDMNFRKGAVDGKEGLYWLDFIKEVKPALVVILMTAFADVDLAVKTMKKGAFDFIQKPWRNARLLSSVLAALELKKTKAEVEGLKSRQKAMNLDSGRSYEKMIGSSSAMMRIKEIVEKLAVTDANILILGENGTGKDLLAMEIHAKSLYKDGPFIHVDLGAIPEQLFEAELFGYVKGAFTDAKDDKPGKFELAAGGTLFMNEIGNLPLHLQSKLLTALQNRKISPLGSNKETDINTRFVCATNKNLQAEITNGKFREDLYYRINTFEIVLNPLRERGDDIMDLFNHFLSQFKAKYGKPDLVATKHVIAKLKSYPWPGNIRELKNAVERCVILSDNKHFDANSFLPEITEMLNISQNSKNLNEIEKQTIVKALKDNKGNITKTAKDLGIHRNALYRRMEKYGL